MVLAAAVLTLSAGAVPSPAADESAPAPTYQVGDWWLLTVEHDMRGRPHRMEIVRIEDGRITVTLGSAKQESVYDLEMNKLQGIEPPSGRLATYAPHTYNFAFPMAPGKEWGGEVTWSAGPYNGKFDVKSKVTGWEDVDLEFRAGPRRGQSEKLRALRIEYEHATQGGVIKSTCWYSPELRFAVRCESTDPTRAYEVVDYSGSRQDAAPPPTPGPGKAS